MAYASTPSLYLFVLSLPLLNPRKMSTSCSFQRLARPSVFQLLGSRAVRDGVGPFVRGCPGQGGSGCVPGGATDSESVNSARHDASTPRLFRDHSSLAAGARLPAQPANSCKSIRDRLLFHVPFQFRTSSHLFAGGYRGSGRKAYRDKLLLDLSK